ncbi:GxxExxY protein [Myxococcota bacterium]
MTENITIRPGYTEPLAEHELTSKIIGAAIHVHKELGPGFVESVYHNALCITLAKRGIKFEKECEVPVIFEDVEVGVHRLDLLVEDRVIVELKAIKRLEPVHFAIVRSYLKAMDLDHGLILNFSKPVLEVKRAMRELVKR